jgi:hypothetical protein
MYREVLGLLHALAVCVLLLLAGQLKEICLRILMEIQR